MTLSRTCKLTSITCAALIFGVCCFAWLAFKQVEPTLFPVIRSFHVTDVEQTDKYTIISGSMNKVRQCKFLDVVAYSGSKFIGITFLNAPKRRKVSRFAGIQEFNNWMLKPPVKHVQIYATHECWSGIVVTELFDGELR